MTAMRRRIILALLIAVLLPLGLQSQNKRQPAPVMGVGGAPWLVRPERIQEEEPDKMLASLEIRKGAVVADVGTGVGYHAWRLAEIVGPTGKVIAEDIQDGMIQLLKKNIVERKLTNVEAVLGSETDPRLPEKAVDLVLMVDVYHEFSKPIEMMANIKKSLNPGGRVVLVEFRKEDPNVPIQPLHKMSVQEVRAEFAAMGFKFEKVLDFLPWQNIIIFTAN